VIYNLADQHHEYYCSVLRMMLYASCDFDNLSDSQTVSRSSNLSWTNGGAFERLGIAQRQSVINKGKQLHLLHIHLRLQTGERFLEAKGNTTIAGQIPTI
jgi:hypothetical protein